MSAGKPYLVGEHGPELVIPGRSGTVMNADLTNKAMGGGNPAPIVNLTYNFQGGVTEADLSRALPVLVERTKREVVDAVQRGGSVARVFR
jgi:phage-related minor tail protein